MNLATLFCDAEQREKRFRQGHRIRGSFKQQAKIVSCQEDMLLMHKPAENSATTRREDKV
jgi:hypothetical protein